MRLFMGVMLVLAVGCDSGATGMVADGAADALAAAGGAGGGAAADAGVAQPDSARAADGAAVMADAMAAPDSASAKPDSGGAAVDTAPAYPTCAPTPAGAVASLDLCGNEGADHTWAYRYKDGLACASCSYVRGGIRTAVTGCKSGGGGFSGLCVASCGECK